MEDLDFPPKTKDHAGNGLYSDDSYYGDSNCSTPFVSAPSSPGRPFEGGGGGGGGYFYSAPASPMHFILAKSSLASSGLVPSPSEAAKCGSGSFEFEFLAKCSKDTSETAVEIGSMSSADELFLNGQIRPMKLSSHLQRPQILAPLMDVAESEETGDEEAEGEDVFQRGRLRDKSVRRRTRSLSPLRITTPFDWCEATVTEEGEVAAAAKSKGGEGENEMEEASNETTPSASASSSRCSSAGRSSKRWVFLKDFLRSKSEGRSNHKFWTNMSFSPGKEKKGEAVAETAQKAARKGGKKPMNGVGKRRVPVSAHELHYTANRAQAEEMRKKTFLPYKQGLLGCLGFSSKSYGAMNGFARALNPVSSR